MSIAAAEVQLVALAAGATCSVLPVLGTEHRQALSGTVSVARANRTAPSCSSAHVQRRGWADPAPEGIPRNHPQPRPRDRRRPLRESHIMQLAHGVARRLCRATRTPQGSARTHRRRCSHSWLPTGDHGRRPRSRPSRTLHSEIGGCSPHHDEGVRVASRTSRRICEPRRARGAIPRDSELDRTIRQGSGGSDGFRSTSRCVGFRLASGGDRRRWNSRPAGQCRRALRLRSSS